MFASRKRQRSMPEDVCQPQVASIRSPTPAASIFGQTLSCPPTLSVGLTALDAPGTMAKTEEYEENPGQNSTTERAVVVASASGGAGGDKGSDSRRRAGDCGGGNNGNMADQQLIPAQDHPSNLRIQTDCCPA